jgi:uncharacterized membrane protein YbhN (UPF0104 family)
MSEHSSLKLRWKLILNIVTVIALIVLVYAIRGQLADTLSNLAKVHAWVLLLLLPLQLVNYHGQTKMYQGLFAMLGNKIRYKFLFRASLELNFVNQVFPSGGVTGISYFGMRMRNKEITGARQRSYRFSNWVCSSCLSKYCSLSAYFCWRWRPG